MRIEVGGELLGIVDLLLRCVMLVLEYEGRQHAESIQQFNRDIGWIDPLPVRNDESGDSATYPRAERWLRHRRGAG